MIRILRTTLIPSLLALGCMPVYAQSEATEVAQKAAESWLALVDESKYGESWDEAAAWFKSQVPKQTWQDAMRSHRAPLGKVESRKLKTAEYTTELSKAPKGEYVVIQYETSFENKPSSIETITPMKEEDGSWGVSGYYIR